MASLLLVDMPFVTGSFLLLAVMPELLVASLLLVDMPFVTSSFLLLAVVPGANNGVLAPSRHALCY